MFVQLAGLSVKARDEQLTYTGDGISRPSVLRSQRRGPRIMPCSLNGIIPELVVAEVQRRNLRPFWERTGSRFDQIWAATSILGFLSQPDGSFLKEHNNVFLCNLQPNQWDFAPASSKMDECTSLGNWTEERRPSW
jgi:hypothetical protein